MITLTIPAANGDSNEINLPGSWGSIDCYGSSFDSGTVTLKQSPDSGDTWITMKDDWGNDIAFTANGSAPFTLAPEKRKVKAVLSGSSGSTDVTCQIRLGWAPTRDREV